jgi:hypothetical protein
LSRNRSGRFFLKCRINAAWRQAIGRAIVIVIWWTSACLDDDEREAHSLDAVHGFAGHLGDRSIQFVLLHEELLSAREKRKLALPGCNYASDTMEEGETINRDGIALPGNEMSTERFQRGICTVCPEQLTWIQETDAKASSLR